MSLLSKLLCIDNSIKFSCYEATHPWNQSCESSIVNLTWQMFQQTLKVYAPLFLANQLLTQKLNADDFVQTFKNTIRSSTFLTSNIIIPLYIVCLTRRVSDKFYFPFVAILPQAIGSFLAIQIERSSRKSPLAFYVLNLASHSYLKNVQLQHFPSMSESTITWIQYSVFLLFSTHLLYRSQKHEYQKDLIGSLLKWLFTSTDRLFSQNVDNCFWSKNNLQQLSMSLLRPLTVFGTIQILAQLVWKRDTNWSKMCSLQFFSITLFVSFYTFFYKTSQSYLTHQTQLNEDQVLCLAGLLASPTFFFFKSTPLVLYTFWRSLLSEFNYRVDQGQLTYKPIYTDLIYTMSASYLFRMAVLEPHLIRPSYLRFLSRITNGTLDNTNRALFGNFMIDSSKAAQFEHKPIDIQIVSPQYLEQIHIWLTK